MDKILYNRIVMYAKDIESGKALPKFCKPWQQDGLETARLIYEYLKFGEPQTAKQIAESFGFSLEYVKQIILALKNGGVEIGAIPEDSGKQHRHQHKYFIEG